MTASRASRIATVAIVVLTCALVGSASAGIDRGRSTVGNTARLNASGTAVQLEGIVYCATCRRFTLGATVSQARSGAVGQGGVRCVCRGAREHWLATARAREATKFEPGAARVCVWIIARGTTGTAIDARQWCESVTLRFAEA